jgi:hypothetical protein
VSFRGHCRGPSRCAHPVPRLPESVPHRKASPLVSWSFDLVQ